MIKQKKVSKILEKKILNKRDPRVESMKELTEILKKIRGEEEGNGDFHNSIAIGNFGAIRSSTSSLKEVEDCMVRLLSKFKDKMPGYIG